MKPIYNFKINDSKVKNIFWYILLLYHTLTKCKKIIFFLLGFNTWLLHRHLHDVIIIIVFMIKKKKYPLPNNTQGVSLGRGYIIICI